MTLGSGLLTDGRLAEIKERLDEGLRFGRIAVDLGFLTPEAPAEAIEEQSRAGVAVLGQVLLRRGDLTSAQVPEVLRRQGRLMLACGGCGRQQDPDEADALSPYTCASCGRLLTLEPPAFAPPAEAPSESPARIGKFRVLSELGRGGMGAVYRAFHRDLNREIALKVVRETQQLHAQHSAADPPA